MLPEAQKSSQYSNVLSLAEALSTRGEKFQAHRQDVLLRGAGDEDARNLQGSRQQGQLIFYQQSRYTASKKSNSASGTLETPSTDE